MGNAESIENNNISTEQNQNYINNNKPYRILTLNRKPKKIKKKETTSSEDTIINDNLDGFINSQNSFKTLINDEGHKMTRYDSPLSQCYTLDHEQKLNKHFNKIKITETTTDIDTDIDSSGINDKKKSVKKHHHHHKHCHRRHNSEKIEKKSNFFLEPLDFDKIYLENDNNKNKNKNNDYNLKNNIKTYLENDNNTTTNNKNPKSLKNKYNSNNNNVNNNYKIKNESNSEPPNFVEAFKNRIKNENSSRSRSRSSSRNKSKQRIESESESENTKNYSESEFNPLTLIYSNQSHSGSSNTGYSDYENTENEEDDDIDYDDDFLYDVLAPISKYQMNNTQSKQQESNTKLNENLNNSSTLVYSSLKNSPITTTSSKTNFNSNSTNKSYIENINYTISSKEEKENNIMNNNISRNNTATSTTFVNSKYYLQGNTTSNTTTANKNNNIWNQSQNNSTLMNNSNTNIWGNSTMNSNSVFSNSNSILSNSILGNSILSNSILGNNNAKYKPSSGSNSEKSQKAKNRKRYTIDDFDIIKKIGQGRYSKVYLANLKGRETKIAIKVLPKTREISKLICQIRQEIRIQSHLHHKNVLKFYDYFRDKKNIYIILEYAKKGSLLEYQKEYHNFSEEVTSNIIKQIAEGLIYIHSKNIVHRDLKPGNILLGENNEIKISDFGCSDMKTNIVAGTLYGTLDYFSPEMIENKMYDERADIWSLGVIMYELLVGETPFDNPSANIVYQKIKNADYSLPSYVSTRASDLLKKILNTNPQERYSLEKILNHPWITQYNY